MAIPSSCDDRGSQHDFYWWPDEDAVGCFNCQAEWVRREHDREED